MPEPIRGYHDILPPNWEKKMKRYRVQLECHQYWRGTVALEASNAREAADKARSIAEEHCEAIEWEEQVADQLYEVAEVEEVGE